MIFKSLKSCKWSVGSDSYNLTKGAEVSIKDEYVDQAKASGLFFEIIIKEDDVIKLNKRKTNSKSSDLK